MRISWTVVIFLLFDQSHAQEDEASAKEMHTYDRLIYPKLDFRCFQFALRRFNFTQDLYRSMYYDVNPTPKLAFGCRTQADDNSHIYYPPLTALDPMMTFYIQKISEGIPLMPVTNVALSFGKTTDRRKQYCVDLRMIGSTFVDYFEIFHSDDETCRQLMEIAVECSIFREMWVDWARNIYERFCLDEDGCYNIMEFYDEDMPYCVKHVARSQFQNASFGSWHHSTLNYCELTDMVPQAKDDNYDRLILNEDGKSDDELLTMCQLLRFRLLPEEGKEEEIREITLRGTVGETDKDGDKDSSAYYKELIYVALTVLSCRF